MYKNNFSELISVPMTVYFIYDKNENNKRIKYKLFSKLQKFRGLFKTRLYCKLRKLSVEEKGEYFLIIFTFIIQTQCQIFQH